MGSQPQKLTAHTGRCKLLYLKSNWNHILSSLFFLVQSNVSVFVLFTVSLFTIKRKKKGLWWNMKNAPFHLSSWRGRVCVWLTAADRFSSSTDSRRKRQSEKHMCWMIHGSRQCSVLWYQREHMGLSHPLHASPTRSHRKARGGGWALLFKQRWGR